MKCPGQPGSMLLMALVLMCGLATNSLAAPTSLPISSLPGGGGATWLNIGNVPFGMTNFQRFNVDDASLGTGSSPQSDAFDGGMTIVVGGTPYVSPSTVDFTGTTITSGPVVLAGLNVTMQYFAHAGSPTLRTFVSLTNPTNSTITTTVSLETNVGSYSGTQIITSSSGDAAFTTADRWVITDDFFSDPSVPSGDPTNTHVLFGPGHPRVIPTATSTTVFQAAGSEGIRADYPITVPGNATVALLFFNRLSPTPNVARRDVTVFDNPAALDTTGLLARLTSADRANTVNWDFGLIPSITPSVTVGDINGDGDVNAVDARLILEVLVGARTPDTPPAIHFTTAGDVNGDGIINNLDAVLLLGRSARQLASLNTLGLARLQEGDTEGARNLFKEATLVAGNQTSNEADTARFFLALTRAAVVGFDLSSDGHPSDMNRAADFLELFGCGQTRRHPLDLQGIFCPSLLPFNAPRGGDVQNFLNNIARPELEGAVSNLNAVSTSFNRLWTEPMHGEQVESDYGDVLFFRAVIKGLLASIAIQNAYNVDVDIDDLFNNTQAALSNNPNFLTLSGTSATNLSEARRWLSEALDDLAATIDAILAETDDQTDDLINLLDRTPQKIARARADIADAKRSLDGATRVRDNNADPTDDFTLNLQPFFAGLNFRSPNLFPPFTGKHPAGLFPDPTFRGIFGSGINLNEDADGDGIPDTLQRRLPHAFE